MRHKNKIKYEQIYEKFAQYSEMIKAIGLSMLYNKDEVDDLVQETWTSCMLYRPELFTWDKKQIDQYIRIVARNEVYKLNSKHSNVITVDFEDESNVSILEQTKKIQGDTDENINLKEMLDNVLKGMSEEFQDIFLLHYEYGYTYDEIAKMKNKKSSAIRKQMSRGMSAIKKAMEDYI